MKTVTRICLCVAALSVTWAALRYISIPIQSIEFPGEPPRISYAESVSIVLTAVTVVLAVLAILLAILAFWGYQNIKENAAVVAQTTADKRIAETLDTQITAELESRIEEIANRKVNAALTGEMYSEAFATDPNNPQPGTAGSLSEEYPEGK